MTRDSSGTRSELARTFEQSVSQGTVAWLGDRPAELARALRFALGRFAEGERLFAVLRSKQTRPMSELRVLDLGCGDGGVCFGLAASGVIGRLVALDKDVNAVLRTVRRSSPSLQYVLARAEALPFPNGSFDVVICLESFEHFTRPRDVGREVMRVLSPGGLCILKTPCRLKYLLRPDPHCGIRGLVLLPDALQRLVVNRLLRRRPPYDVHHTYWHLGEILEHFPGYGFLEVIWDKPFPTTNWLLDHLWFKYRFFHWENLLIQKRDPARPCAPSRWQEWPFPFAQLTDAETPLLLPAGGESQGDGRGAPAR